MKFDQEYRTPEGFTDQPYIHVYDGDALTDATDYTNVPVVVPHDGAAFVLRQIYGRNNLCARIQFRDSAAPLTSADAGIVMPNTYPIIPERVILPEGALVGDFYTVARAVRDQTIFYAQLAFQGVRRWPLGESLPGITKYPADSQYRYWEKSFAYDLTVTVDWAGTDPTPRQFFIPVDDNDFVLQRVTIVRQQQADADNFGIPNFEIKLNIYDSYPRPLMSAPVLDVILNDAADATVHPYNGVFPVPGVLFRRGSVIQFDVVSLLTAALLDSQYQVVFQGVRRIPC